MKCRHARSLIPDHAEGRLGREVQVQLEAHLADCRDCRKIHEELAGRLEWLDRAFASAGEQCVIGDGLADAVAARIRHEQAVRPSVRRLSFGEIARPAAAFAAIVAILTIAFAVLFNHLSAPSMHAATELRSGRQFAYTVRPAPDGTVDAGVTRRRYARIQTPEARWPR